MGQQQLLLIILGVIIVGIAVAVGITMFTGGAREANRDAIINDLANLSARAQMYFRRPLAMGGGQNSFGGFGLAAADSANANGDYSVVTALPAGVAHVPGSTAAIGAGTVTTIYIVGCGRELGNVPGAGSDQHTKAYATVTGTGFVTTVLN